MPRLAASLLVLGSGLWGCACALVGSPYQPAPTGPRDPPEAPPLSLDELHLTVVYPPSEGRGATSGERQVVRTDSAYRIGSRDSTFLFGSAGRGDARLTINGNEIPVFSTGGWIAWLPLPLDSVAVFEVVAVAGADTAALELSAPLATESGLPEAVPWIDTTSFSPRGDQWIRPGEGVTLSMRATPGARVRGVLSDGRFIEFVEDGTPDPLPWGVRAFDTDLSRKVAERPALDRYVASWQEAIGPSPGSVLDPDSLPVADDTRWMRVEVTVGDDTACAIWPLRLGVLDSAPPIVVVVDDDPTGTGATDGLLPGRPVPHGTYHWFFPNGTIARVSGRLNGQLRLQLSRTSVAWVNANEVTTLTAGTPPPGGRIGSMRLVPAEGSVVLRIPLPARVPYRIDESESELGLTLYGVAADADWIQYGDTDPFVRLITFSQRSEDEMVVSVALSRAVWGYRTRWDANDLLLEIRRPPPINPDRPLAKVAVALDAGHPPAGATGPTGVREADVVLAVVLKAARLLEQYGSHVTLTRDSEEPLGLVERTAAAEDADVLVSVHANALPDGVNPFVNNGTSVYYFHPRSVDLARDLDRALVRQFGFRDLGIGRGDLALARPTWMPAVLAEGLFMMIPEQEAVLASEDGQWRYARGLVEGIAEFLRRRALRDR